jgi:hypothetical protein
MMRWDEKRNGIKRKERKEKGKKRGISGMHICIGWRPDTNAPPPKHTHTSTG